MTRLEWFFVFGSEWMAFVWHIFGSSELADWNVLIQRHILRHSDMKVCLRSRALLLGCEYFGIVYWLCSQDFGAIFAVTRDGHKYGNVVATDLFITLYLLPVGSFGECDVMMARRRR